MSKRLPCPPAPGPLEEYAKSFDHLFATLAQRRGFREYLQGLLLPRDRNKTLTALTGAEPISGAQAAPAQRLQFFLSESDWDADTVNTRRLELLRGDPETAPHGEGVLVIDETGDRKDGTKTAHVAHQYLGSNKREAAVGTGPPAPEVQPVRQTPEAVGEKRRGERTGKPAPVMAGGSQRGAELAGSVDHALALLASVVESAPAERAASAA